MGGRVTRNEAEPPEDVDGLLWRMLADALDRPCNKEHTVHRDDPSDYLARLWVNCGDETIDSQSFDKRVDSPDSMAEFCRYVTRTHKERTRHRAVYDAVTAWLAIGEGVTS
jgi:hypothetical protein